MYNLEALCALAVAFLCADVEARTVGAAFIFDPRTYQDPEVLTFNVTCESKCDIDFVKVSRLTGSLKMTIRSPTTAICTDQPYKCSRNSRIPEKYFIVTLKPNPSFTNGALEVFLRNDETAKFQVIYAEGAYPYDSEDSVENCPIASGYQTTRFPTLFKQYRVECKGPCKGIYFWTGPGEKVLLAAALDPVFVKKGGCYNCFCLSLEDNGGNQECLYNGKFGFDLQSSKFYITMIPNNEATDVWSIVSGNLKSVKEFKFTRTYFESWNGDSNVIVYPISGPVRSHKEVELVVECYPKCKRVTIEIGTDETNVRVYAGEKINLDSNNVCNSCDCTDVSTCQKRFDPKFVGRDNPTKLRVRVILKGTKRRYPAYVKVSSDGLFDYSLSSMREY